MPGSIRPAPARPAAPSRRRCCSRCRAAARSPKAWRRCRKRRGREGRRRVQRACGRGGHRACLDRRHVAAAGLRLGVGDADQRDVAAAAPSAASAATDAGHAIDAQQRESRDASSATRSAWPRPGSVMTLQPSTSRRSVSTWPAAETKTPVPYSTLRRGASARPRARSPAGTADRRRRSARPADPSCLPSPGRRGCVRPRTSPSARIAVTRIFFRPCMPAMREGRPSRRLLRGDAAPRQLLLLLEHGLERRAGVDAERLDLQLALLRAPARAGRSRWSAWWRTSPECRRARRSPDPRPAASRPRRWRGATAAASAARSSGAQQAGDLELVALLVVLHRLGEPVAELAVGRAAVVAGPGQVELDRQRGRRAAAPCRCRAGRAASVRRRLQLPVVADFALAFFLSCLAGLLARRPCRRSAARPPCYRRLFVGRGLRSRFGFLGGFGAGLAAGLRRLGACGLASGLGLPRVAATGP